MRIICTAIALSLIVGCAGVKQNLKDPGAADAVGGAVGNAVETVTHDAGLAALIGGAVGYGIRWFQKRSAAKPAA